MRFFTFFAAILIANLASAQSFHFVVDTLQDNVYPFHDENYIANFAVNNSEETKVMRWTQTTIFKGAKWSNAQVCDNFLCYTDKIKTKTIQLGSGDTTLMKILFKPNGQDTSGYYTISIQEEGASTLDDLAHFFFNGSTASTKRINNVETVKIFPNPSTDYIQLNSKELVKNITIYNATGIIVREVNNYNNGLIQVKDFPSGIYYIMIDFYNGKTGVSKLMKK